MRHLSAKSCGYPRAARSPSSAHCPAFGRNSDDGSRSDGSFTTAFLDRVRPDQDDCDGRAPGALTLNVRHPICGDLPISQTCQRQSIAVGVLGALDDLIENNRRRIELLEQMAQAIYREWFVHFRYPGHEDGTLVDSPLGPIPEVGNVAASDLPQSIAMLVHRSPGYLSRSTRRTDREVRDQSRDSWSVSTSPIVVFVTDEQAMSCVV